MGNDDGIEERLLQLHNKPISESPTDDNLKIRVFEESKKIWKVGFPNIISRVSFWGCYVITQSFFGHINSTDLAGYALVQTLLVRFICGILLGMSSATETLCGQAYGAKQYHMMGIFLQRSWLVNLATVTITLPILLFGGQIFKVLGQEQIISQSAGTISLWFIPFCYFYIFSQTIQMYLQAQQRNAIIVYLSVIQFTVHIFLSWLFVSVLNWGVAGAMAAINISVAVLVAGELIYILCGWCPDSWKGFSVAALSDIIPVVKLSISSGVMVCIELWYNAFLVLIAGYMKDAETGISAFSICLNINVWEFMIPLGLLGSACVRVANELGRGDAKAVKFSIKVILSTSSVIGVTIWILCLIFGNKIGPLFSDDEAVIKIVADLSVLLAFSMLFNSIYPVLSGVAVGAGLQSTVAIVNVVCYYVIGLPVGMLLGYATSLQLKGIWIGMLGGIICQTLVLCYMTWRTDWDEEVLKTSRRLKKWYLKSSDHDEEGHGQEKD